MRARGLLVLCLFSALADCAAAAPRPRHSEQDALQALNAVTEELDREIVELERREAPTNHRRHDHLDLERSKAPLAKPLGDLERRGIFPDDRISALTTCLAGLPKDSKGGGDNVIGDLSTALSDFGKVLPKLTETLLKGGDVLGELAAVATESAAPELEKVLKMAEKDLPPFIGALFDDEGGDVLGIKKALVGARSGGSKAVETQTNALERARQGRYCAVICTGARAGAYFCDTAACRGELRLPYSSHDGAAALEASRPVEVLNLEEEEVNEEASSKGTSGASAPEERPGSLAAEVEALRKVGDGAGDKLLGAVEALLVELAKNHAHDPVGCALEHVALPLLRDKKLHTALKKGVAVAFKALVSLYEALRRPAAHVQGKGGSRGDLERHEKGGASGEAARDDASDDDQSSLAVEFEAVSMAVGPAEGAEAQRESRRGSRRRPARGAHLSAHAADLEASVDELAGKVSKVVRDALQHHDVEEAVQQKVVGEVQEGVRAEVAALGPQLSAGSAKEPRPSQEPKSVARTDPVQGVLMLVAKAAGPVLFDALMGEERRQILDNSLQGAVGQACNVVSDALGAVVDSIHPPEVDGKPLCLYDVDGKAPKTKDVFTVVVMVLTSMALDLLHAHVYTPLEVELIAVAQTVVSDLAVDLDGLCGLIPEVGGLICAIVEMVVVTVVEQAGPAMVESVAEAMYEALRNFMMSNVELWAENMMAPDHLGKAADAVDMLVEQAGEALDFIRPALEFIVPIAQQAGTAILPKVGAAVEACEKQLQLLDRLIKAKFQCK